MNSAADLDTTRLEVVTGTPWTVVPASGDAPAYAWTVFPADDPNHGADLVAVIRHDGEAWAPMFHEQAADDGVPYVPNSKPWTLYYAGATDAGTPEEEWEAWAHGPAPYALAAEARWFADGRPAV